MSFQNPFVAALDNIIDNPIGRGGQADSYSRYASSLVVLKAWEEDIYCSPGSLNFAGSAYMLRIQQSLKGT
jgi:hypothetical protein